MSTIIYDVSIDESLFSLGEICERCGVHAEIVIEMVEYGIVDPVVDRERKRWQFTAAALQRLRQAQRLRNDLELNLPGLALSLELLDEIAALKNEVTALKQQLSKLHN